MKLDLCDYVKDIYGYKQLSLLNVDRYPDRFICFQADSFFGNVQLEIDQCRITTPTFSH